MRQTSPNVLLVGSDPDGSKVEETLTRFAGVTRVPGIQDAFSTVAPDACDAVFCQWEFTGGTWRDVLKKVGELRLQIPVIVLSRCGGERQWVEVLQAGAFDLLVPPYTNYQILAVLEHALASRPKEATAA
jgi:DNA-binding NtrC family response regulator